LRFLPPGKLKLGPHFALLNCLEIVNPLIQTLIAVDIECQCLLVVIIEKICSRKLGFQRPKAEIIFCSVKQILPDGFSAKLAFFMIFIITVFLMMEFYIQLFNFIDGMLCVKVFNCCGVLMLPILNHPSLLFSIAQSRFSN